MKNIIQAILSKKIYVLLSLTFWVGWANAQTFTVTNTNNNGAGSFDAAYGAAMATGAGAVVDINFNIPGGGPHTINIGGWLNAFGNRTIRINGNTQPGYAAGSPKIIFTSGQYRIFEMDGGNNHLIHGVIFQNAQNGIVIKSGSGHKVTGCWFGLNGNGSASGALTENGIVVDNSGANNITIGGTTDAERNVIANCSQNGIRINAAGNNLRIIGNYIGTDPTGTISVKNGASNYLTNSGISMASNSSTTIADNVISGNHSIGITAESSNNLQIKRNIIGLDKTGTKPLPNGTTGIRLLNSTNVTIGGSAADKNIISGNGLTSVPHEYRTGNTAKFDMSNSAGIYIEKGVKNSTISYNYIGTDITGLLIKSAAASSPDLGNIGNGIKLETTDPGNATTGNVISHNVVGGNGYGTENVAGLGFPSHGILIRNPASLNNRVEFNMIGISHDNATNIANKYTGIEMQGIHGATVRKNTICNNVWGIFLQSDFNGNTPGVCADNIIASNKIGVDSTGKVAFGNRGAGTEGGGVRIIDKSNNNTIGGLSPELGNVISANRIGIRIEGTGTVSNKVYNNIIGLNIDQSSAMPNQEYGVVIDELAASSIIGSATAGNIIAGNTQGGVFIDNAINNTLSGNRIGLNAAGTSIPNGGNGVQIQNGSVRNVIGSATAGAGNIIANHPKNGVEILDATSTKNSIRNNSIYCNALRGIELNLLGNDHATNLPPTFSGSETAIVVTGKSGSWIEIYALDGCNDCSVDETSKKLQGKTLLKAGPSPLTFAGTAGVKYTATASEASNTGEISLTTGGNTSEFSSCYTLCKSPNTADPVVTAEASPICLGSNGSVKVTNAEVGFIYQAMVNGANAGASVTAATTEVILQIPASFLPAGTHEIKVTAKILAICSAVPLADTATIVVNKKPDPRTATGSTVCSVTTGGNSANATVTITNPEAGVTYVAFKGNTQLVGQSYSAGVITIPVTSLTVGNNALVIHGKVAGCADENVATATITVNPNPPSNLTVKGSTICGTGTDSATVTIDNPTANVVYVAYKGTTELTGQKYKAGIISIPTSSLTNPGDNEITIHARINGCVDVVLDNKANIKINEKPGPPTAQGSVICSNAPEGTITVSNPRSDVTYVAYSGNSVIADQSYAAGVIKVKRSSLQEGDNIINVHAEIPGCVTVASLSTVNIRVNHYPDQKSISATGPICENTNSTLTLVNPQAGVTYTVIDSLGTVVKTLSPTLPASGVQAYTLSGIGFHILKVKASIEGCGVVNMSDTAGVQVNDGPDPVEVDGIVDTLCSNANSLSFTITNAEDLVTYDVFEGTQKLNTSPINKANPSFKIENISVGTHTYTIKGTAGGCDAATVKEFTVVVNELPNTTGITLSANDYNVCENNKITVSVDPTKSPLYTYTLIDSVGNLINVAPIRGNNAKASFEAYAFPVGRHKVTVIESVKSCKSDTLKNGIIIEIDSTIKVDLPELYADSNVVCQDAEIKLVLKRTQKGVAYTLKENNKVVETKTATASNQEITFGPYTAVYPPKDHTFTLVGSTKGCDSVLINTSVTVVVNEKPDAKKLMISANDSILCSGQSITFGVKTTRNADYSYHLVDNGTKLGETTLGNSGTLSFGAYVLPVGTHEIRVVESVRACQSTTSDPLVVTVDPPLADTAVIAANRDTTCTDAQFEVTISKTQINVAYTLFQSFNGGAGKVIASKKATANGEVLTFGPLGPLVAGTYDYFVKASSNGCDSATLTSKDRVVVNEKPTPSIGVTFKKNPICIDESAVLVIDDGALTGVTYSIYRKLANKDTLLGTTKTNEFTTPLYTAAGEDNLYVVASVSGCTDVRLSAEPKVVINEFPNRNLVSEGATVCHDDPANVIVKLFGTDNKWPYSVKIGNSSFGPQNTLTADLSFEIAKSSVAKGVNQIIFSVDVQGCGSDTVAVDTVYSIGEINGLSGRPTVCIGDTTTYTAPRMMGIQGYKFTIPEKAVLVSSDDFSVRVTFPDTSATGRIRAYPIGTIGLCDKIYDSLYVRVYPPKEGVFGFINNDTICVGDTIWVGLQGMEGISFDSLFRINAPDGDIVYLDTIASLFDFDSYKLHFTKVGKYVLEYKTISECTKEIDTVRQTIVVLPYPVANAGEYPIIDMKHYPREVVLDGSNSSHSTSEYPFVYKWSMKPYSNITNSNSMVASFVPEQTTQDVMLWVANAHKGMCPTRDTARITIDLGIFIPNVFTPNNDGDHDTWEILNVNAFYPEVNVEIYSKWGTLIYSSKGYPTAWDGTRNGQDVPAATYYYVIDLKKPGFKPVAGSVTIIR